MESHEQSKDEVQYTEDFETVVEKEWQLVKKRRERMCKDCPPTETTKNTGDHQDKAENTATERELIGLALSGGGIRSATTNIGVLQGLSQSGVLPVVDYLSAVSGGGYVAASLASLLANSGKEGSFSTIWKKFPFREDLLDGESLKKPWDGRIQMHHMRIKANFLAPRAMHFSTNVMAAVGSVFISTFMSLLWFALMVTLITSVYMFIVSGVAPDLGKQDDLTIFRQPESAVVSADSPAAPSAKDRGTRSKEIFSAPAKKIGAYVVAPYKNFKEIKGAWLGGIIGGIVAFGLGYVLLYKRFYFRKKKEDEAAGAEKTFGSVFLALGVVLLLSWVFLFGKAGKSAAEGAMLVVPPLFAAVSLLWVWGFYANFARKSNAPEEKKCSNGKRTSESWVREHRFDYHVLAGVLFVALFFTLVWAALPGLMTIGSVKDMTLMLVAIGLGLRTLIAGNQGKSSTLEKKFTLPAKYKEWLLGLAVGLFLLLAVVYAGNVLSSALYDGKWPYLEVRNSHFRLLWVSVGALVLLRCFGWLVDVNKISPHYFYRDRLAETFLVTEKESEPDQDKPPVTSRDDGRMELAKLYGSADASNQTASRSPYLLLNATLNLTAARNLKAFNRKSDIFTFSSCYVGSVSTGYRETADYRVDDGPLKLARAMTISGAAVTSVMGMNTSALTAFLCTFFGVRLGYWMPPVKEAGGDKGNMAEKWPMNMIKMIGGLATSRLLREMIGCVTAEEGREIYLSDGGHSGDNLGIIPLLRRRVKVLLVSDSECDPNHDFDSLNSSIRNAYVDENIKITICLDGLRKDEKGLTMDKFAVGRISYPDQDKEAKNWLIIYKNTLRGDEMAAIVNYQKKSPTFPHESTGDQFFTEEQFESYRALGRFAVDNALKSKEEWLRACSCSDREVSMDVYLFFKDRLIRDCSGKA